MIDPRYANAGGIPFPPGYGGQQGPPTYYHHHRHHRHHKHKVRNDDSPLSRDESIHKVDHSQPQYLPQNDAVPLGSGYGVPYGGGAAGYYAQQQYGGGNFGYANQYQDQFGGGAGQAVKQRRHHRHHRHHTTTTGGGLEQAQGVPEQLIGQRSESVLGKERQGASPVAIVEGSNDGGQYTHHRHHRRHHHHRQTHGGGEQASFGQTHQSRLGQYHTAAAADGYGHINDDLIFIERGEHSPHRQEPPSGYTYKGKIEVQGVDKEIRSQVFTGGSVAPPPVAPSYPAPPPPAPSSGPCPPGWQTMVITGGSYGPCSSGGSVYTGQLVGGASAAQTGISGGYSSGTAYGSYGATSAALPPNCRLVADYVFGGSTSGAYQGQQQQQQTQEYTSTRPTIIEVWQKRPKSESRERSRSRQRSRSPRPDFDFDKFRADILAAIERMLPRGGETGTQTHPTETRIIETRTEAPGEVRVIVQPIQPVFYMPKQTPTGPVPVGPAPVQPAPSAPNVIYVPRNVYVPVIKPVFVPRERVIVRPQVIHVARPVLVDRPVPVTQRPIIIDRERPIPVPVRAGAAATGGGSKIVREEYVYRDNLPVAYGGRCAEFAGGVNYGYVPTQQEHQYASSSTHELSSIYQGGGENFNVGQEVFQQSAGGAANFNVGQEVFQQSAAAATTGYTGPGSIEILDAAVNPTWIRTEETSLVRRYGRPAAEIVQKSKQVEQQMYSELRQRSSSGVRSASTVSYGSGSNIIVGGGGLPPC